MIDHTRAPAIKGTIPAFTPVPRQCQRHDGWTPERQQGFIDALANLGSVKAAAHAVNMAPEGAYLLRRHAEGGEFRKAWEAALKCGVQRLEDVAMDRALNGVEVPVYHFGQVAGHRTVYNDRLLMFILRNRSSKRFAADGSRRPNAVARSQLAKLRQQWRDEWDKEQRAKLERSREEVKASIQRKVEEMRQTILRSREKHPPHVEAARREYERLLGEWEAGEESRRTAKPAA